MSVASEDWLFRLRVALLHQLAGYGFITSDFVSDWVRRNPAPVHPESEVGRAYARIEGLDMQARVGQLEKRVRQLADQVETNQVAYLETKVVDLHTRVADLEGRSFPGRWIPAGETVTIRAATCCVPWQTCAYHPKLPNPPTG